MNRVLNYLPFTNQIKYSNLLSLDKTEGHFRNTVWDPFLITSQIMALQSIFYVSLSIWLSLICFLVGTSRSLDHIFKYQEIQIRDISGKIVVAGFLFNALTGACALWFLVQRTRLCLDFSSTAHFIHLLACWYYNGDFPSSLSWWLLNIICLAIMCIYGEFLCLRTELKAIPLHMGQKVDL